MYVSWGLGYDSVVFLLMAVRTLYLQWTYKGITSAEGATLGMVRNLARDGAYYFGCVPLFWTRVRLICVSCIFSMNLMWIIMILHAPIGLRAIAAVYVLTSLLAASFDVSLTQPFLLVS
jgi:hypothetical protein